jgi:uracil-DNA glycosylase family 4
MFVCESPSNWPGRGESPEPARCFVHDKTKLFHRMREEQGFADCFITNAVKCGPRRGKSLHAEEEILACAGFLEREIRLIDPLVIVGVGTQATITLATFVLPKLENPPALHSIHHFAAHLSQEHLFETWSRQFAELLALLSQLNAAGPIRKR